MHHVDRATPWEEIWQAMEQLVREGKVTYVGSSNFAAWDVALAQSAAHVRQFLGLISSSALTTCPSGASRWSWCAPCAAWASD